MVVAAAALALLVLERAIVSARPSGAQAPASSSPARTAEETSSAPGAQSPNGYSDDELRDIVDTLVQLANGRAALPASGGPSTSSLAGPTPTGQPAGDQGAPPLATRERSPAPARSFPVGPVTAALGMAVVSACLAVAAWRWHRRRSRRGGRRLAIQRAEGDRLPPEEASGAGVAERVDVALRHAWAAGTHRGRGAAPSVLAVRVGSLGLELLVEPPQPHAAGRFVAAENGRLWTLGPDVATAELEASARGQRAPLPALATVGATEEGAVLVDLCRARVLSVEGDRSRVGALLAGVALELATAPWAADTTVLLVGGDPRLARLDNVEPVAVPGCGGAGLAPEGLESLDIKSRLRRSRSERAAATVVVVAPDSAAPDALDDIADEVRAPGPDVALVAPGPLPGAEWRLVVAADASAVLEPVGFELRCGVDAEAVAATVAALAGPPPAATPAVLVDDEVAAGGDQECRVLVLGPPVVRWPNVGDGRRPNRRKLEEVVAYLATHPERPVPAERLRTAIWPLAEDERAGEVADSTFRGTMSRARAALGARPDGLPYLPEACDGGYRLDPSFGCDWVRFRDLVAGSRSAPPNEAAGLLRGALSLVRGAPFADAPRGAYGWAWSEQLSSAIEVAVADAAERLAELALAAGDCLGARWAAHTGLLVVPTRESLYRARMRASFEAGDLDDVEQAWTEVRRAARSIDEGEEPQAETAALYRQLRRALRPKPAEADTERVPVASAL